MLRCLSFGSMEDGVTNGIRTRTTAITGPDAAVTSWSPLLMVALHAGAAPAAAARQAAMLADTPMELVEDGSPPWTRTTTTRLTGGHAALTSAGNGSFARYRAAVSCLSGGCSAIELRRMEKMVAASGIAPDSARLQRAANLSQLHSRGSPVRNRTAVCRLQGGGSAIELRGNEEWSRAPVLPRVSPRPKRGGLLSSSRANY